MRGTEVKGCPVCAVRPESEWLLSLYSGSQFPVISAQGIGPGPAILYGPDPGKWPAWWHDAVTAINAARQAANVIEARS